MKKLLIILLFGLVTISCSKDDIMATPDLSLVGKWQLIEVLQDPGDGSGVYTQVESNETISFTEDSKFILTRSLCGSANNTSGTYDTVRSVLTPADCALAQPGIYELSYEHLGSILIISPLCIEPCGWKYKKVVDSDI